MNRIPRRGDVAMTSRFQTDPAQMDVQLRCCPEKPDNEIPLFPPQKATTERLVSVINASRRISIQPRTFCTKIPVGRKQP
jgi:hypothetical protein